MASFQSKLFIALLQLINKKSFLSRQLKSGQFNRFGSPAPSLELYHTALIRQFKVNKKNVFTLRPRNGNSSGTHILYLHGGAYVQGFVKPHWTFISKILKATSCTITAPDYPLAPDHTYKDAFAMVELLYKQLISETDPRHLILMGDSAGGGFALALLQKLRNDNIPLPERTILLCPWLDITLNNPDIDPIDRHDPFLGRESLQQAGKLYAGGDDPAHYMLSPINGPLEGLGKISVFAGSGEILVADTRKLKSLATSKGIDIDYHEYPDMIHTWMLLNFPESDKARQQITDLIKSV